MRDTRLGAPRAPKPQPVFHRSAPPPAMHAPVPRYGYAQPTHSNVVLAPEVRADVRAAAVPPPPYTAAPASHSLAPVAMSAPTGSYPRFQHQTGSHSSPMVVGGTPTVKWGLGILAGGALVGALLGVGLNQRDTSAAAGQMTDPEPAVLVAPAAPAQAVPQTATVAQGTVAYPAGYQAQAPAQPVAVVATTTPPPAAPGAGYVTVAAPAAPVAAAPVNVIPPQVAVVVPPAAKKTVAHHAPAKHAKHAKKSHRAHTTRAPAPRVSVAAKVPAQKAEKAEAPAPKKQVKRDADADAVLQNAIANTTNTLGGS